MDMPFFEKSLLTNDPPSGLSVYLKALWYDRKANWDKAHEIIQDVHNKNAAWVHAYLHRKEGDDANAGYWYRKAGKPMPVVDLDTEWKQLATAFLIDTNAQS